MFNQRMKIMADVSIQIQNVTKCYKHYQNNTDRIMEALHFSRKPKHSLFYAVKDVCLTIHRGEVIGVLGQNGSGKSTLLKMISGIVQPTEGQISVHGKISALLELGAGFNPEYTGIENIMLQGTIMGYSAKEMNQKIPEIEKFADIGEFIHQPVKMYSSGMFARLAFSVAVTVQPEVLIIDEVLSVGDMRFQIKCMDRMSEMMKGGTTVLFVSHDINAIRRFCTRAIWIHAGTVMADGDVNLTADQYADFMKAHDVGEELSAIKENYSFSLETSQDEKPFVPGKNIAQIIDFKMLDRYGAGIRDIVSFDQAVTIEVVYDVYEEIENPVLGIAIETIDHDYTCGLNTMLDKVSIPWQYGRNKFRLEYPMGLRALGGRYYFDVALFEKTASVPMHYISQVKKFTIIANYVGEGRFIIPHQWHA